MNFENSVQFLQENFPKISRKKIEEELNIYLIKKYEKKNISENINFEIDENILIELMNIIQLNNKLNDKNKEMKENEDLLETIKILEQKENMNKDNFNDTKTIMNIDNENKDNIEIKENNLSSQLYTSINNKEFINEEKEINFYNEKNLEVNLIHMENEKEKENIIDEKNIKEEYIEEKKENINKDKKNENNKKILQLSLLEMQFSKSLLEDENIKKNIKAKNFYIIDENTLINIVLVLDKIIIQLMLYYNEKQLNSDEQILHFKNFFTIIYKLLNNIYLYPNEEKYRYIKFSNNQIRSNFMLNEHIFDLLKISFQLIFFNTNFSQNDKKENISDENEKMNNVNDNNSNINLIWKLENTFNDEENIIFEFTLDCIKIIMGKIRREKDIKTNEQKKNEKIEKIEKITILEKSRTPKNINLTYINQNEEKKKEINDIRKLYDERYKTHKIYAENTYTPKKWNFLKNKNVQNNKNININNNLNDNECVDTNDTIKKKKKN